MPDQLDVLSIVFLLKYTSNRGITSLDNLGRYIDRYILPFTQNLNKKQSTYQHLEFASCGNISLGEKKIETAFLNNYPGLFSRGLTKEQLEPVPVNTKDIIIVALHNKERFQVSALDDKVLDDLLQQRALSDEDKSRMKTLFSAERMSVNEVKEYLLSLRPGLSSLFDVWDNSSMKNMTLTSVGIAIAHANIQRKIGEKFDLSIWI
jgi:hypothetical protein